VRRGLQGAEAASADTPPSAAPYVAPASAFSISSISTTHVRTLRNCLVTFETAIAGHWLLSAPNRSPRSLVPQRSAFGLLCPEDKAYLLPLQMAIIRHSYVWSHGFVRQLSALLAGRARPCAHCRNSASFANKRQYPFGANAPPSQAERSLWRQGCEDSTDRAK
jgi:hypothetical protein